MHTSWVQKLFAAESSPLSRFSAENTLIAGHDCNIQRIQKAKVEKLSNSTVHHTLGFKKRVGDVVGDVVPSVVVYLHLHHHSSRVGKVQWAHKNGLIAAAIGTLSMLTSEPTAKKKQGKGDTYVRPLTLVTLHITKERTVTNGTFAPHTKAK